MSDQGNWPEARLHRLWALQKRARLVSARVIVKNERIHVIRDGNEQAFDTLAAAERELASIQPNNQ